VKPLYTAKGLYLLIVAMVSMLAGKAQTTSLEFASGGGPAGPGASVANQVVTFKENTNNPIGNTFVAWNTPTTTTTFSFINQQYTLPITQLATGLPLNFGTAINGGGPKALNSPLYVQMSSLGSPVDPDFTSTDNVTPGTGISTTNNYAMEIFISAAPLYNNGVSSNGSYYMGDMNITFNTPLTNPVIHVVGIGATNGGLGFAGEFDLKTPGITLSKLSGSTELSVAGNKIVNSAAHPTSTTGSGAASGSILATGTNISSLSFKVYLNGDGGGSWGGSNVHAGDQILIAVSLEANTTILPVGFTRFSAIAQSGKSRLEWTTATESNTAFFDIQHSTDQATWQSIGSIIAAGNSSTQKDYSFLHANPAPGANFYRLRVMKLDDSYTFSAIRELSFAEALLRLTGYPNPTKGSFTIVGNGTAITTVTVMSLDGKPLQVLTNFFSGNTINLSQYPTGLYLIAVKDETGDTRLIKVFRE